MRDLGIGRLWAGTEESLHYLLERFVSLTPEQMALFFGDEDDEPHKAPGEPRLLHRQGDIGVVTMKGPLVNNDDKWWNTFFGLTGYGELREALVAAAQDEDIKSIMLDIDSPGGSVAGMSDIADLVKQVDGMKPVYAHTSGTMASAAYAIGSQARQITASRMADVGSIGVLIVHRESTKYMEKMGITNTVIRSGEFKALGNPYEALSETAQKTLQDSCDYSYKLFMEQVAEARGVSAEFVREHMAEGRVFTGEQAKAVHLVDDITNYDTALSNLLLSDESERDKDGKIVQYSPDPLDSQNKNNMKSTLTPMAVAAAKAAKEAADKAATKAAEELTPEQKAAADEAAKVAADGAAAKEAGDAKEKDEGDGIGIALEASAELTKANARIEVLAEDKAALQAQLTIAQAEITALKAAADKSAKSVEGLRAIAQTTVRTLNIALDHAVGAEMSMTDEALVSEHQRLSALFDANFKAGGIAAPGVTQAANTEVDVEHAARLKAARLNRK